MLAYHSDPKIKAGVLRQLAVHRALDQIVKGQYWKGGKGCAIACTLHSSNHMEYETRFGIPVMLARLEDCIFEGLPNHLAMEWPERFMGAITPSADLSLIGWKFLHWLLTDATVNPGIDHPLVRDAVRQCADVIAPLTKGEPADESAERSAESAAESAWRAWSAARSAESAAESAESAADSAAWSAAESAWSAESAASSAAESAWRAARSAAYVLMADKLIAMISDAPIAMGGA